MKIGVIARADDRGLGTQTWEVARNLHPEKVLVVRVPGSEAQGFTPHLDRFPGAMVLTVNEHSWTLPEAEVRAWLDGLDVVYTAETLYDWRIADWGRDQGVATVVHCNPEFYMHHKRVLPDPAAWWAPTDWRLNHLPVTTTVVPMPCPVDRFTPDPDDGSTSVLHVGGRTAVGDRNGTDVALMASHLVDITVSTQTGVRRPQRATVVGHSDNWWDLYDGHAALVLPRRYGGLCLPIIEACAAGLVPIVTDCTPNRMWPIEPIRATSGRQVKLPGGWIDTYDCDPQAVADAVNRVVPNLPQRRRSVIQWAHDHSWEALAPQWLEHFERATVAKAPKPPSVTVIVPFTPGKCPQRDRVWAWVKARYERLHPTWDVIEAHHDGEWCKAAAIQSVIGDVTSDVVIVADADVYAPPADLAFAASRIAAGAPWVVPWRNVHRLTQEETERVLDSTPGHRVPERQRRRHHIYYEGVAGGGLVVIPRSAWDVAPMDDRFIGWGYEDVCWGSALDTLVGEHLRLDGDLIHLWHPPQPNRENPSQASTELHNAYMEAHRMPRRMRSVVYRSEEELVPLDQPVTFRANVRVMVFPGRRIRFVDHHYTTDDPDLVEALRARPEVEEVA